jgi:hypothetical protein
VKDIRRRVIADLLELAGFVVNAFSGRHRHPRGRHAAVDNSHLTTPAMPVVRPVEHEGATERFGTELRAMRHIEVSPELVSDIEVELQWGLIWHEFERKMQVEIDKTFAPYLTVECRDFDELRDKIGLRELVAV